MGNLKTGGVGQKIHDYPFWDNVGEIRRAFSKKTSTWACLGPLSDLGLFNFKMISDCFNLVLETLPDKEYI